MTILIVGATEGSFGDAIYNAIRAELPDGDLNNTYDVVTAGVNGEQIYFNALDAIGEHQELLSDVRPQHIVYAAGVNVGDAAGALAMSAHHHMSVNLFGFLTLAEAFRESAPVGSQLVAVSSNSAHIARSPSLGYCASKAALSMAVRVLARRWKEKPYVYGYEPGLMDTDATKRAVDEGEWFGAAHRMPGVDSPYGLRAGTVARVVAQNLLGGGRHLNGTLLRMDSGEQ